MIANAKTLSLVCGFGFLAGLGLGSLSGARGHLPANSQTRTQMESVAIAVARPPAAVMPWGQLEAQRLPLGSREELFADRAVRLQPSCWFFENQAVDHVVDFLRSCELDESQQAQLMDSSKWQSVSNGCFLRPANSLVLSLSGAAREKIYRVLAASDTNYAQRFSFRFTPGDFETRFPGTDLTPAHRELLKRLTYTHWGNVCFADVQLLPELLSQAEFAEVIDGLYRFPAYRLRLRVHPDSDVEGLMRYWGKGTQGARIRPLLESLANMPQPEGESLSITYLLPPFARLRLFTFPSAWPEPEAVREDCIWTSLNFENDQPDMRYLDRVFTRKVLDTEYSMVTVRPTFGDLIGLVNERGDVIHMCVYIADDFVFTKNGVNPLQPWLIMKMSDLLTAFPSEKNYPLVIYRKKEAA